MEDVGLEMIGMDNDAIKCSVKIGISTSRIISVYL